jgi:hypothetical protein
MNASRTLSHPEAAVLLEAGVARGYSMARPTPSTYLLTVFVFWAMKRWTWLCWNGAYLAWVWTLTCRAGLSHRVLGLPLRERVSQF